MIDRKSIVLWSLMIILTLGEALFWWSGVQTGKFGLMDRSRYVELQGLPTHGIARIVVNFQHFFLFWEEPPTTEKYANLKDVWLSDGSSPGRNLLHPLCFAGLPFLLILAFRYSWKESLLWLLIFNVLREYIGEGWRLEPSFSDLWIDTVSAFIGVFIAVRLLTKTTHPKAENTAA